jgi:hypothetical protein
LEARSRSVFGSVGVGLRRIAYGTLRERTGGSLPFVCDKTMQFNFDITV